MTRSTATLFSVLSLLIACGSNKTTGEPVTLHTKLGSDLAADRTFTTGAGWVVTLEQARFATGPLYYYDGEPAFTSVDRRPLRRFVEFLSPLQTAWAHPGHYIPGNAVGQMTEPFSVDLLAGTTPLPDGNGITGTARSATFSFAAPSAGPASADLSGHVVIASGRATKDQTTVYFRFNGELADIERTAKDAQVTGCKFEEAEIAGDGEVKVTVKPRVWFNLVDFSVVAPGTASSPTIVEPTSTPHLAFALGLAQLSAYEFSLAQ